MKTFVQIVGVCIFGWSLVYIFMLITSVPQVFVVSGSLGDEKNPDAWNIKQIKNSEGQVVPQQLWSDVLKGRIEVVLVTPSWQPTER